MGVQQHQQHENNNNKNQSKTSFTWSRRQDKPLLWGGVGVGHSGCIAAGLDGIHSFKEMLTFFTFFLSRHFLSIETLLSMSWSKYKLFSYCDIFDDNYFAFILLKKSCGWSLISVVEFVSLCRFCCHSLHFFGCYSCLAKHLPWIQSMTVCFRILMQYVLYYQS